MTTPGSFTTQTSDMIAVHRALVEALEAAPDLVGGAGDDGERVEVIASYYENVLEFLHVHHTGEDELIYPILEERCAEHKEVLKEIDAQHSLLNDPMNEARMAIATWRASPSVEGGHEVISLIGTIDAVLRPHLDDEETTVLPIASAWISQDEWARLPGHALQSFSADKPWLALGLVRERLTEEQKDQMLSGMPQQLQTVWTEQWEPAFTAFITRVRH